MKRIIIIMFVIAIALANTFAQPSAIHVTKTGKGQAILYLPGFTTPGSVWDETVKNIQGKHEHHRVSYAGFNGLPAIPMPWYETIKAELIGYIQKEKLNNVTIVGHSMGGMLALDVAAVIPAVVKNLVIVDALPCMREVMMPGVSANQLAYESPYNQQMLQMSDEAFVQTATMIAQSMTNQKEKVDVIKQWSKEADRKTYVYGYTDLLKLDLREVLDKIQAKTLILAAPFPNKEVVSATLQKQYDKLASKTIEVATDSRHFIMFDQPAWFYEQVNAFLKN